MDRRILIGFIASLILIGTACTDNITEMEIEKVVPVEAQRVDEEERFRQSNYLGTVKPEKTIQLSFKTGGRVDRITVRKGDRVKKGDILVSLDKTDLIYAENLAKSQLEMAEAQYEKAFNGATEEDIEQAKLNVVKAEDGYRYALDRFAEVEELYLNGTSTKQQYEQAALEVNIREADLKLAREIQSQVQKGARFEEIKALSAQLESARTEYNYRKNQVNEATLKSPIEGTVLDVLCEEGEIAGTGYPVIVVCNDEKSVHVGVPEKELKNITKQTEVTIEKGGMSVKSGIVRISEIPDDLTGLYDVEISGNEFDVPFGASINVNFSFGMGKGIYIPITAILNDGVDYVYTVLEERAVRKNISIEEIDKFEARVTGLNIEDLLVTSGMNRINSGDKVTVKEINYVSNN